MFDDMLFVKFKATVLPTLENCPALDVMTFRPPFITFAKADIITGVWLETDVAIPPMAILIDFADAITLDDTEDNFDGILEIVSTMV